MVIYIIYSENNDKEFLPIGTGGFFQGRNPNVEVNILEEKWVEGANVLYIGKAGGIAGNGRVYNSTLHSRIKLYFKFGIGMPVGHWGGTI